MVFPEQWALLLLLLALHLKDIFIHSVQLLLLLLLFVHLLN